MCLRSAWSAVVWLAPSHSILCQAWTQEGVKVPPLICTRGIIIIIIIIITYIERPANITCWAPAQIYTEGMHLQAWAEPYTMVVTLVAATPLRLHLVGLHTQYANRSCKAMDVGGLANLTNLTCRPHRLLSRMLRLLSTWSCTHSNSCQLLVGKNGHSHLLCSYCAVKSRLVSMYKAWSTQITTESVKHTYDPCITQVLNGPH